MKGSIITLIMIFFGISSAIICFRKAREAERKGEPGTASFYALLTVLTLINVVVMYLLK
jgi:hypothetical protein